MINSWGCHWQSDLVNALLSRDSESESESLSVLLVWLDMLEEVVELPEFVGLEPLSATVCAGKISIGTSSLDAGVSVAVGETHWLGLSASGDEVIVWFRCCIVSLVPVCLGGQLFMEAR